MRSQVDLGAGTRGAAVRYPAAMQPVEPQPVDAPKPQTVHRGLTSTEAAELLAKHGPNILQAQARTPLWRLVVDQFSGALVQLLLVACALSAVLGELGDAIAIAAILLLNAAVGVRQEHHAEQAVLALQQMTAPRARVRRDGHAQQIAAENVVPGDVLVLDAGDIVAADGLLARAAALEVVEAALTGESLPVTKAPGTAVPDAPLAEQHTRVFAGTHVANGSAEAVVQHTGMQTELGKIAALLAAVPHELTPLQQRLQQVGRVLMILCLVIVAVVAGVGLWQGRPWLEVLMTSVSLAVAAVPEGLAAMVTVALAVGVQRMARQQVLVRHLPAVETLGCTSVICTDKTGTLTEGKMTLRHVVGADPDVVLRAAVLCCDADLGEGETAASGDPTEIAILQAGLARGLDLTALDLALPRTLTLPFDAVRKRMSIRRADGVLYCKGALDGLVPLCQEVPPELLADAERLAGQGVRVLAVAVGQQDQEVDLQLIGLLGLADPPRASAQAAVAAARAAGITTVMITGDDPRTAEAIARELGIVVGNEVVAERVHARATPADKLAIVQGWKDRGAVVAMTGDGVNDAPALKQAHIGIAMGIAGTEVTRQAADMVLANDEFASIVAAVQEGRGIYLNIRKALVYLLAGNAAELLVMLGAALLALPVPLLPLHLLWINLVTDGAPALMLVAEPAAAEVMREPPRPLQEPMLGAPQWRHVLAVGSVEAMVVLVAFATTLASGRPLEEARTVAFSTLVLSEVLRALPARHPTLPFWQPGWRRSRKLLAVLAATLLLQLVVLFWGPSQRLFALAPPSLLDAEIVLALGVFPTTLLELWKAWLRRQAT